MGMVLVVGGYRDLADLTLIGRRPLAKSFTLEQEVAALDEGIGKPGAV